MQTFRVGIFTEVYRPVRNGVVASVEMLEDQLRQRGHDVVCVTPAMPGYRDTQLGVLRLPSLPLPTRTAYRLTLPIVNRERMAALRDISIVHTHSPFITGWTGVRIARRLRVPVVFTYHTQLEYYAHYVPFEPYTTKYAVSKLTNLFANAVDTVIVPTSSMERHLRDAGIQGRIEVVPSGIDVARFRAGRRSDEVRANLGAATHETLILYVGRLGREKNPELALRTFARMNGASKLAVVGDGVERAPLERLAARLAPGRVRFTGERPRDSLPDIYASGDALLFTSTSETQGLVLVEALAAGLPVVAVDTPAGRDVLGNAGRLCGADPEALVHGLTAVLGDGEAGRRRGVEVAGRFDAALMAARILGVYASLVGQTR